MAEAYAYLVESLILKPTGYSPFLATKREALFHKPRNQQQQPAQQLQPVRVADIQQLRTSVANLSQQVQKLQSCSGSPTQKQDNVQRWFQNHAAAFDAPRSSSSSVSLTTVQQPHPRRYSAACQQEHLDLSQPAACAAAAAAMALYGKHAGLPPDAAAAAVGAAAVFAQRLSYSSEPGSSYQSSGSARLSSCCMVPPLEYDASDEEQRQLEDEAPGEFLCPIGRVLMTDPVCTPSGFTYQRSFLEDFLAKTGHDPARDTPLNASQLYPNIVMRDQIATWLQQHGIAT
uniref:U-box domain-containing protein n=1 Tax=Tetradesmus obliquus TaxID=3088 RepID=A0A383V769_TETOB|eukprot:jgi/Sobl393_1/14331/SZX60196.1